MTRSRRTHRLPGALALAVAALAVGYAIIRPIHRRWGATDEEVARPMPGDLEIIGWTRAVSIEASADRIWPWLAQWGQGRGGWYSYDWLENLLGFDIHTADRILPEHQKPRVGDSICLARGVCISKIFVVEPGRFLGWQATMPDGSPAWTFLLALFPVDENHTRLIVRESFAKGAMPPAALFAMELPDAVMELKALDTVRRRAEGAGASSLRNVLEALLWLAAFVPGAAAARWTLTRGRWQLPLALGLCSEAVLLALTFLFPPLWLRAGLDVGLWSAMVWTASRTEGVPALGAPPEDRSRS